MTTTWLFTRADSTTLALGIDEDYITEGFEPFKASDVRTGDQDTPGGQIAGLDVESGRPMTMLVSYAAYADRATLQTKFEALARFFRPSNEDIMVTWQLPGEQARTRFVRSRGVDDPTDADDFYAETTRLNFRSVDPRSYGDEDSVTVDASTSVEIGGLWPTRQWLFVVDGPCTGPSFTGVRADGAPFTIACPDLELLSGDRWEIDGRTGDIRKWIDDPGEWFYNVGATRPAVLETLTADIFTAAFTSSSGADTGDLTYRPAY